MINPSDQSDLQSVSQIQILKLKKKKKRHFSYLATVNLNRISNFDYIIRTNEEKQ